MNHLSKILGNCSPIRAFQGWAYVSTSQKGAVSGDSSSQEILTVNTENIDPSLAGTSQVTDRVCVDGGVCVDELSRESILADGTLCKEYFP